MCAIRAFAAQDDSLATTEVDHHHHHGLLEGLTDTTVGTSGSRRNLLMLSLERWMFGKSKKEKEEEAEEEAEEAELIEEAEEEAPAPTLPLTDNAGVPLPFVPKNIDPKSSVAGLMASMASSQEEGSSTAINQQKPQLEEEIVWPSSPVPIGNPLLLTNPPVYDTKGATR
eukprot:CAMPEP_0118925508 /NCGR_PEP_ID=MMETSP1169-20130426/3386_1 /TAXON_ID=36882 /ORGANISM="Pyramimonas obovata, Strain CCMP722" /LENGTH=169 /DNA_ID=CAMNT_0006866829 /DNA_START=375 /DNA_END=885 /DNA_ORIENTATION=+